MSKPDYETITDVSTSELDQDQLAEVVGDLLDHLGLKVQRRWYCFHGDPSGEEINVVAWDAPTKQLED